jgi:hypothetical protein
MEKKNFFLILKHSYGKKVIKSRNMGTPVGGNQKSILPLEIYFLHQPMR